MILTLKKAQAYTYEKTKLNIYQITQTICFFFQWRKKYEAQNVSRYSVYRSVHHEYIFITNSFWAVHKSRLSSLLGLSPYAWSLSHSPAERRHRAQYIYTHRPWLLSNSSWLILWMSLNNLFIFFFPSSIVLLLLFWPHKCRSIDLIRKVRYLGLFRA